MKNAQPDMATMTYELLKDFKRDVDKNFDNVSKRFDNVDKRIDSLENSVNSLDNRMNSLDKRMFKVENNIDKLNDTREQIKLSFERSYIPKLTLFVIAISSMTYILLDGIKSQIV